MQVNGSGLGIGKTPLVGIFSLAVANVFANGQLGDLDLQRGGDGRWEVLWQFVSCPSVNATVDVHFAPAATPL